MINLKEETASSNLSSASKNTDPSYTFEVKKSPAATRINLWIRSFGKWLEVLNQWKTESSLIDRLIGISILGEDKDNRQLHQLENSLKYLIESSIKELEKEILDMQQNIEILQRYVLNTDIKVKEIKMRMQKLSEAYSNLKLTIFQELARTYPITIF
ncbi:MAG: hypothetical protein KDC53_08005 [Saprospiraceae bacterium]|nr:hypothetical protein [Saprospiraceae bacterium]